MILGLFTEIVSDGGVQRVGRHAAIALEDIARARGEPCTNLSINDPVEETRFEVGGSSSAVRGFAGRRAPYIAAALAAARRASLVYMGHPGIAPIALGIRLFNPRCPYWVHVHGTDIWPRLSFLDRLALRRATGIISISRYSANQAIRMNDVPPNLIHIVPNALEPELTARTLSVRALPPAPTLLTVARLAACEQYKGVDSVIRALSAVRRAVPEVRYVVVGDGDDRPRLETLARECGVADRVDFAGRVSENELAARYRDAAVFVMPSSGEGFGVAYLEAMAFAKPCIGGDHGGAPEVVEEGVTGFVVDREAIDVLAERITRLLTTPELLSRMGEQGRRRVEERYTFEHFRRGLRQVMIGE
ncbi:MAG: glycosyltransferase family 4 protein [Gemmatimonadota bacterium]|nr:glycosyltransferase family 4 protein [Gemmatimonadota bacterium]